MEVRQALHQNPLCLSRSTNISICALHAHPPCRAYVEVRRALHQNSICRAPLLNPGHSKGELLELYRLHLQQSDMPTDFGTLLQLR